MQVGGPQAPPHHLEVAPWPGDRGSAPLRCYPTLRLFTGPALGTKSAEEAILPTLAASHDRGQAAHVKRTHADEPSVRSNHLCVQAQPISLCVLIVINL